MEVAVAATKTESPKEAASALFILAFWMMAPTTAIVSRARGKGWGMSRLSTKPST